MAEIRTEVTLENAADRWLVRHGHATEPEVRHTTVDGIVDTRVATLRLPQNVVERLGLRRQGTAFRHGRRQSGSKNGRVPVP